ncbi:MAG: septal ring lytic transglycosylase RlpA family protein [Desulfobacteraceae bacterium]|nr:MAG: septal ring lytic transglycosylase RlpA family protein [Desulfobacteraceae bacterium]
MKFRKKEGLTAKLRKPNSKSSLPLPAISACILILSCSAARLTYDVTEKTVATTYKVTKRVVKTGIGAGKVIYRIGEFTFVVVSAPLTWPLTREEIVSIDDLPPKEAIRSQRVKMAPYVVNGRRYVPMSTTKAEKYREEGVASWYGYETYRQKGGRMTANGEAFHPNGLNAAHKYLPLPTYVRVTNLENRKSIIVRVNDRGPFVDGRIIDLSAGAARRLGFYEKGTARVHVEALKL